MQAGRKYTLLQTVNWGRKYLFIFLIIDSIPVILYQFLHLEWLTVIPWQPISLIGIALAFYLGFKNNSSYERLWEARKIWGGIVNASRSFTVMARDFINNDEAKTKLEEAELESVRRSVVDCLIAWMYALTYQLRKIQPWEHNSMADSKFRESLGMNYSEDLFQNLKKYLTDNEFNYIMSKGNKASHLLSIQSKRLMELRRKGVIEHFRHLELQNLITEFYTLQGQSERIKNFPFPRQYASANFSFATIFVLLLPFGMLNIVSEFEPSHFIWLAIPFSVICSWVFWTMEMIGDYSENPFEGLYNDVPISAMAKGIEADILQMLEETDLPEQPKPQGELQILV